MYQKNKFNLEYYFMLVVDMYKDFDNRNKAEIFISMAIESGVNIIQLRDTQKNKYKEKLNIINKIKNIYPKSNIIINSDINLANESLADGIHIKESEWKNDIVKQIDQRLVIGKSTHINSMPSINEYSPDYLIFGTVFSSKSHPRIRPVGSEKISIIKKKYIYPVLAIGGINEKNTSKVIKAGADGVAIKSGIIERENPKKIITLIKNILMKKNDIY